jgi:3-oxoacyl-[acyl-carrier protein] reductase
MNPADGHSADLLRSMIPLRRFGTADEIAGFVAYLASPESGFVTGASLTIDGGLTV